MKRSMDKIAVERDRLRAIIDEIESVEGTASRGVDALQESIDALSELL